MINSFQSINKSNLIKYTCKRYKYHIAIVGSGPSGFYCSKYLLEKHNDVFIDMYEKLPMPFGLVRYGVAPDHPEVKSVTSTFHDIGNNKRFRYFGNVSIGHFDNKYNNISFESLVKSYSATILAYGASEDIDIGLPNENKPGVISARQFVNWYNSHPNYKHIGKLINLPKVKDVVIIGNGNVAIDCARILLKDPKSELNNTDISIDALRQLENCNIENVTIIGRRGHIQASFTIKELREISRLPNINLQVNKMELQEGLTPASEIELLETKSKHRLVDLINKLSDSPISDSKSNNKNVKFRFLLNPVEIHYSETSNSINGLTVCKNSLVGDKFEQRVINTASYEYIPTQLIIKSIGYKSIPINGVPFDYNRNIVTNELGRTNHKNVYVCGWLKRGPNGIIGTNIVDAKETVSTIINDINSNILFAVDDDPIDNISIIRNNHTIITWKDYLLLDEIECQNGQTYEPKKTREKLTDIIEILNILDNKRIK